MLLDKDQIQEIAAGLRSNKLRIVLTGFAVGWGVLLLVILLGAGQGINNGVHTSFQAVSKSNNALELNSGWTSQPYKGFGKGRYIELTIEDSERIRENVPEVEAVSPYHKTWSYDLRYTERSMSYLPIDGVLGDYRKFQNVKLMTDNSRFINQSDNTHARKVIVISDAAATNLFGTAEAAIHKTVVLSGNGNSFSPEKTSFPFTVIGVYKGGEAQYSACFIPFETFRSLHMNVWSKPNQIWGAYLYCPTVKGRSQTTKMQQQITRLLAPVHQYSPADDQVIYLESYSEQNGMFDKVFLAFDTLLWIIGMSTLAIGIVGVVNIMQVTVTERKREFGIRKALGAKPRDIIGMVLRESVFVTLISGLIGLMIGVGLMVLASHLMQINGWGNITIEDDRVIPLMQDPVITFWTAVGAVTVMVLSGLLAGYLPARKAVKIQAIEAMHG